jgi:hypothetical protein
VIASHAAGVDFPRLACMDALGIAHAAPRARPQRFFQARSALRFDAGMIARARLRSLLKPNESIWPYLLADPLPHALGRFGRTHVEESAAAVERRVHKAA